MGDTPAWMQGKPADEAGSQPAWMQGKPAQEPAWKSGSPIIERPALESTVTTSARPQGGGGLPKYISEPINAVTGELAQAGREIKQNPLKAAKDTALGVAGAIPRFGKKLVEAPVGLYTIAAPESGSAYLKDLRDFYGWDNGQNFAPQSAMGNVGAGVGDLGMNALQMLATGQAGGTSMLGRTVLPMTASGLEGAGMQAAEASQIPGITPGRIRAAGAARGLLDALSAGVPMSDYLKKTLTVPGGLAAEAALFTGTGEGIRAISDPNYQGPSGADLLRNFLATGGTVAGGHFVGQGTKRLMQQNLAANQQPSGELGTGAANVNQEPGERPTQFFQRLLYGANQAKRADEIALNGIAQRINAKHSPDAQAAAMEYLSQRNAGNVSAPLTPEVQAVLADPDVQALRNISSQRAAASGIEKPEEWYAPRVVTAGLPEDELANAGRPQALGPASHGSLKSRSMMMAEPVGGGQPLAVSADESGATVMGKTGPTGESLTKTEAGDWVDSKGQKYTIRPGAISELEGGSPFTYSKNLADAYTNSILGQGEAIRTKQKQLALRGTGMIVDPTTEPKAQGLKDQGWVPLGHEYGADAGKIVAPELKYVLDNVITEGAPRTGRLAKVADSMQAVNNGVLKATFQLMPTAHATNMQSHFTKSAMGIAFRYPKLLGELPGLMDKAAEVEASIRSGSPSKEALDYLQSGGVVMGGSGGREYAGDLRSRLSSLLNREQPTDMPRSTDLSNRVTWQNDDKARIALYLMRRAGGEDAPTAVKKVNDAYPSYQSNYAPTGKEWLDKAADFTLNNPMFVFQNYMRGKVGAVQTMLKKGAAPSSSMDDRREALGNAIGMGLNVALAGAGTAAVVGLTGDERKKKGLGGGEHFLGDAASVAQGSLGVPEFLTRQAQISPATRALGGLTMAATGKLMNPTDRAAAASGDTDAMKNMGSTLVKQTGLGFTGTGIPGTEGEGSNPLLNLLGIKKDFTPAERYVSDVHAYNLPPTADRAKAMSDMRAIQEAIRTKNMGAIGDIFAKGNITGRELEGAIERAGMGKVSRPIALAVSAKSLKDDDFLNLVQRANPEERKYVLVLAGDKIASALNPNVAPNVLKKRAAVLVKIFGQDAVAKAMQDNAATEQDNPLEATQMRPPQP